MLRESVTVTSVTGGVTEHATGGGLEGAERFARETAMWAPTIRAPDDIINPGKPMADARGRDMAMNDGPTHGAVATHMNSIVGGHYRLNANPNWRALKQITGRSFDETWAEEFQQMAEARFDLIAESESCYLDASGTNTLTGLTRLAVGGFVMTGEVLATAEWLRGGTRPLKTAVQMVSPDRLCNPNDEPDTRLMRRGIERDFNGRPQAYHFRQAHPGTFHWDAAAQEYKWRRVAAEKPWGRKQVIHIIEQRFPDQSRGIADMVAALKHMRMTKHLDEITLQNAVIQATYAAAIESELPPEAVVAMMGGNTGPEAYMTAINSYMGALGQYVSASKNINIDGAKMAHLFPGTKLSVKPVGTPGGIGTNFEQSLQRHTAAALGLSYEEFAKDFSKVSYSAARASMAHTERFMMARKKLVADRFAGNVYALVLEEEMGLNNLPMPRGVSPALARDLFYYPLAKEAFTRASWIGAGRGQIDELKETQAAILRIKSGLSTYEYEISKMGGDFREVFAQRAREEGIIKTHGLAFALDTQRPGAKDRQNTMSDDPDSGADNDDVDADDTAEEDAA